MWQTNNNTFINIELQISPGQKTLKKVTLSFPSLSDGGHGCWASIQGKAGLCLQNLVFFSIYSVFVLVIIDSISAGGRYWYSSGNVWPWYVWEIHENIFSLNIHN